MATIVSLKFGNSSLHWILDNVNCMAIDLTAWIDGDQMKNHNYTLNCNSMIQWTSRYIVHHWMANNSKAIVPHLISCNALQSIVNTLNLVDWLKGSYFWNIFVKYRNMTTIKTTRTWIDQSLLIWRHIAKVYFWIRPRDVLFTWCCLNYSIELMFQWLIVVKINPFNWCPLS